MKKLLVICGNKEYIFDICDDEFEILDEEYSNDLYDHEEFTEFMSEKDDLLVEIIKNNEHEAFSDIDVDDVVIHYYERRDNYDVIAELILL